MSASHLVIDTGSCEIKAGFAGDDAPQCIFDNIIGEAKYPKCMSGALEGFHVGEKVQKHRGMLRLRYPMSHGSVVDWDALEHVWAHIYSKLGLMSEEHMVLLTEIPHTPSKMKAKMAEIFYETFNVPGIYFALQPVLSLYATGNSTGVVLDVGHGSTHAVSVYEGYCIPHAVVRVNLGGNDVTEHLQLLLRKSGVNFTTSGELEMLRFMKESICMVAFNIVKEEEMVQKDKYDTVAYKLPDGQELSVGAERFRAPEILFNPSIVGSECSSTQEVLFQSIQKCDTDIRKSLFESVHVVGGTTLLAGFGDRLLNEVRKISPKEITIRMRASAERKYMTWVGGSILAALAAFRPACVSKQKYHDEGVRAFSNF